MYINTFASTMFIITNFLLANQIASLQTIECQWEGFFNRRKDI